ncbi:MAG: IPT/TIG domain-containing protein [Prevotellaceae bacterium]|jgi:hypothetical protein|nr:IPT/TIG domain-containing protein [Prevotellaceae bacterium]
MNKIKNFRLVIICLTAFAGWYSCNNNANEKNVPPHDPDKAVELTRFFPDSGGIASKVLIEGVNFGNDTSSFSVFFNEKKAAVISVQGDKAYVLTPRLPGDTCVITVKAGDKTVASTHRFRYITQMTVTTIAGARGANGGKFKEGPLAQAAFANISGMCVDAAGNIFLAMKSDVGVCRVDVKGNQVTFITGNIGNSGSWNSGCVDPVTQIAYLISDANSLILELNPSNLWVPRARTITHPTEEEIESGEKQDFTISYTHSLAYNPVDSCLYTRQYQSGEIIKINQRTYEAECVHATGQGDQPGSDSYLAFDPLDPNYIYLSYPNRHCIRRYNMTTKIFEPFASAPTATGSWRDGPLNDAEFNTPRGIAFDQDGILYVADRSNHCIRAINRQGIVSTVAGVPRQWGTADGDPTTAGFDNPYMVAIDIEGNIWIGEDSNNRMLRKLTIE